MQQTTKNQHLEIPGNPSTTKTNTNKLNDRSNGVKLRVLSEEDWQFWIDNGYIVIKNAVPKEQAKKQQIFYGNLKKKILITLIHGMKLLGLKCK